MVPVREELEAARPDVIIELSTDHFSNFYHLNMPAFSVAVLDRGLGPERNQTMPEYTVPSDAAFASALLRHGLRSGVDWSFNHELVLDHSWLVPLHFLTPRMDVPVVPLHVNGVAPPLPLASRCLEVGATIAEFVASLEDSTRVALLASGSFALEVGGPKAGWTDMEWMETVRGHLAEGRTRSSRLRRPRSEWRPRVTPQASF